MNNYVEKIRRGDSLTNFHDVELRETVDNINRELSTDTTTIEGNPLNFTTLSAQTAKSTILSVEPIQDLHGYDKPWIGGAGKNLLPMTVEGIKNANTSGSWSGNVYSINNGTFTILTDFDNNVVGIQPNGTFNADTSFKIGVKSVKVNDSYKFNGCPSGGSDSTYLLYIENKPSTYFDYGSGANWTISSDDDFSVAIFVKSGYNISNKIFYPMIRLATVTDDTFEPYTNISSISGHDQIDILGCGKNLLEGVENGTWTTANQGKSASTNRARSTKLIKVESSTQYCISAKSSDSKTIQTIAQFYSDIGEDTFISETSGWENVSRLFTTPENCKYIAIIFRTSNNDNNPENYMSEVQLEKSNQVTDYSPYTKSNDLTISLGQTVYGGTLDVENGVLVVDRKTITLNGSESTWESVGGNYPQAYRLTSNIAIDGDASQNNFFVNFTNKYPKLTTNNPEYGMRFRNSHPEELLVYDARFQNDLTNFLVELSTNNLQFCYYLATPLEIQLAPNEISLLKGVNNISTDGDKITLTYRNGKFATLDGAVPKMTFRGEDYTMGVDDIGLFLENLTKSTKTYIANPLLNFDGTVATYKKIMKQWFINNGVNIMDSTGITYLCERWYEITKQGWKGGTSFPAVGVSTGSIGTRFDDNVGMSVTPSTDTSANTDTYQGLPLFAITDCNWELDSDGNILITAIDGITDNFVRDDPTKFVGVMQQTGWVKKVDDATTQKYYYADDKDAYEDLVPLPEAIKLDGTVRSFVVHAKYMSGIVDSKMTCCSGVIPRRNISHDSLVTLPDNIGTQYSGGTSVDWSFLIWMQRIKYASLTSDGVLQGCCNYNYQYYVKVGETGVKRLILSSANGANLKVGSTVTFGAYAGNADRGQAATYSISGQDGAIITSIEDVTIDGTTYKAVYVDTTSTFDTVANGDATNGTTIVSTHHWISGTCDTVKGNDGSPVSATNGVYPAKLQGIEFMVGGYEVMADVIMNISGGYYNPYYARKSTDQATSITSSMVQSTLKCAQPSSDAWRYIQKHGFDGEIFYPVLTGTSSSEYMKDGFYENGTSTSTGTREWLGFGALNTGSGLAGMSCLYGGTGLGSGGWNFVARLSCNGNRGILLTA